MYIGLFNTIEATVSECPHCGNLFLPRRKNMIFCKENCRKAFSRGPQNSANSRTKARKNAELFDAARRMGEKYYLIPPIERLGYLKELIDDARSGNTALREILSNWKLMHPNPINETWIFPRGHRNYSTIAQLAQFYCWRFWKADVADVVYNRVSDPPTGEVDGDDSLEM